MVAGREAGSRLQLTIDVDDVDAMCAEVTARGVELLNGPMDRPWGVRTASFSDPGGHPEGPASLVSRVGGIFACMIRFIALLRVHRSPRSYAHGG
jgi:Glyoxalase/Bleomycin resistance protein/Dioxygenase superfamily